MLHDSKSLADQKDHECHSVIISRTARCSFVQTLQSAAVVLFAFLFLAWLALSRTQIVDAPFTPSVAQSSESDIEQLWGQYSPYFPVTKYQPPPRGCKVTQVNIIQRHGSRSPTSGASIAIQVSVAKLLEARNYTDPRLDFLANYTYDLGQDDLIPLGALESFSAGELQYKRYRDLISHDNLPFVRASSSKRVVESATNWTAGFASASNKLFNPNLSLVLQEHLNDTLTNKMCPKAGNADEQTHHWQSIFAPAIVSRLNQAAPGANLADVNIPYLMSLCPFETVAKETRSQFCDLFTQKEFEAFEYYGDLNKYYGFGYGQALGKVQGVGYVNELLARLTGQPVQDHTQTNRTLDSSPDTFPLNRSMYVDFSHDNTMTAIYTALGLFQQPRHLDPGHPDPHRTWIVSRMVPFSGRMVTEKVQCRAGRTMKEFVRILVDDAVQLLEFCYGEHGLCELDVFIQSQGYARSDGAGDFDKCFS